MQAPNFGGADLTNFPFEFFMQFQTKFLYFSTIMQKLKNGQKVKSRLYCFILSPKFNYHSVTYFQLPFYVYIK